MGKKKMKMKLLPFLNSHRSSSSSWQWPSCQQQPRTLSFRKANHCSSSSSYIQLLESPPDSEIQFESPRESFDSGDSVVRGLSSDRLLFEPRETSSILKESSPRSAKLVFDEQTASAVFLSMESMDPLIDFKKSMEEMVEAHGYHHHNDWPRLEELLCCYLRVNAKTNHAYVFAAFLQLLAQLEAATTSTSRSSSSSSVYCSCSQSPSSPLSNFYSSSSSSADDEEIHPHNVGCSSALVSRNLKEIIKDCCYDAI